MPYLRSALVHNGGLSLSRPDCSVLRPSQPPQWSQMRPSQPRAEVPDAISVQEGGTRILILELARTDHLVQGHWPRDRGAAKDEKRRPLREAIAAITGATVAKATRVLGFRGGLCGSEWRARLAPLALSPTAFLDLRRGAVRSAWQSCGSRDHSANPQPGQGRVAGGGGSIRELARTSFKHRTSSAFCPPAVSRSIQRAAHHQAARCPP